ncbi:ABC transporter substrate-binding protein [bacterium]|nr:ABC transporter substrate-binding protein [bacterium]
MLRNITVILAAAAVVALPFLLRPAGETTDWRRGDPVLVIVSPHNEAIRYEFERGFAAWYRARCGRPVKIDWRSIGGTSEIARYLESEFVAATRAWWVAQGRSWPAGAGELLLARRFDQPEPPPGPGHDRWRELRDLHRAARAVDDPGQVSCQIDLFFGGGVYDHSKAHDAGLTVMPWPTGDPPVGLLVDERGVVLIPETVSGETWRTPWLFGTAIGTFGICYNLDRLADLGVSRPPAAWRDLTDPVYRGQVGVADPTKSGSIAKAFENVVHQCCYDTVRAAGFDEAAIDRFEAAIKAARLPPGELPAGVPAAYQAAVEDGWRSGVLVLQRIGANARYFTDAASRVPVDVSVGDAAVGLAIDFYARFQAEISRGPGGREKMTYLTPAGGSSVSADPISLLRGAPGRELAVQFIEYVLSADGQRLWTYRPGTPGGPQRFALRRIPIRRDFFPSEDPRLQSAHEQHRRHAADDLASPAINPYALARHFVYRPRWTAGHFSAHRDLVKAMCLDANDELRAAWRAIQEHGGAARQSRALALLQRLPDRPEPLTWRSAPRIMREHDRLDYLRDWTAFFRASYREAEEAVVRAAGSDRRNLDRGTGVPPVHRVGHPARRAGSDRSRGRERSAGPQTARWGIGQAGRLSHEEASGIAGRGESGQAGRLSHAMVNQRHQTGSGS